MSLWILQVSILEWAAYPFLQGASQPRNRTGVSCIAGGFSTNWAIKEAPQTICSPEILYAYHHYFLSPVFSLLSHSLNKSTSKFSSTVIFLTAHPLFLNKCDSLLVSFSIFNPTCSEQIQSPYLMLYNKYLKDKFLSLSKSSINHAQFCPFILVPIIHYSLIQSLISLLTVPTSDASTLI